MTVRGQPGDGTGNGTAGPSWAPYGLVLLVALSIALGCARRDEVPPLELRAQQLNKAIMCPVCPGESIDQSQNPLAVQMRGIVVEKLDQGWSEGQIKDFFVEGYGPTVLLEPPRSGVGLAAWVIPPVAVVAAGSLLYLALRVMRRPRPELGTAGEVDSLSEAELADYFERAEAALGPQATDTEPRRED